MSTKGGTGVKINYHQYSKTLKQAHPIEKQCIITRSISMIQFNSHYFDKAWSNNIRVIQASK